MILLTAETPSGILRRVRANCYSPAMLTAVNAQDHDQVHLILGPAWKELVLRHTISFG
jgi:hypothetical protein